MILVSSSLAVALTTESAPVNFTSAKIITMTICGAINFFNVIFSSIVCYTNSKV